MNTNNDNITLFQLYGHGDTLNVTWAPKLIKKKFPNIKINFACKKSHACFFENNKHVDKIIIIDEAKALRCRAVAKPKLFCDELNLWCGSGKTKVEIMGARSWDIPWESAKIINNHFKSEVISLNDNLLPELIYTQDEIEKANAFVEKNWPYIIIEIECFSGQHTMNPVGIMNLISNNLKRKDIKIFTSYFGGNFVKPFLSLNSFSIKEVGLLIERSLAFYGIGSGISVVSWERNLKEPKKRVVSFYNDLWLNNLKRYREMENTIAILPKDFIDFVIKDIKLYSIDKAENPRL